MIWSGRAVSEDILLSTFTEAKFTVCEELWSVWVGRQAKRLLRACSCEQLHCRYRQISDAPSRIEGKSLVPSHYPRGRVPITQFFCKTSYCHAQKVGCKTTKFGRMIYQSQIMNTRGSLKYSFKGSVTLHTPAPGLYISFSDIFASWRFGLTWRRLTGCCRRWPCCPFGSL